MSLVEYIGHDDSATLTYNGNRYVGKRGEQIDVPAALAAALPINWSTAGGVKGDPGTNGTNGTNGADGAAAITPSSYKSFATLPTDITADQSTSLTGLAVSGGLLTKTDANDHSFHLTSQTVTDYKAMVKVVPGALTGTTGANRIIYLCGKYIDDSNFLMFQDGAGSGSINLFQFVAGSGTNLGSVSSPGVGTNAKPYWLVLRQSGNVVRAEVYTSDPRLFPANLATGVTSVTLSGTAITALGAGVAGKPGLRHGGGSTDWALDDWVVVEPSGVSICEF